MKQTWAGLWIDNFKGVVVLPEDGGCEILTIYSNLESKHRSTGGKGKSRPYMHESGPFSAQHFEGHQANVRHEFFMDVGSVLRDATELLVLGSGRTPKDFVKQFMEQEHPSNIKISIEKFEDVSVNELQKKVLEHFGHAAPRTLPNLPGQPIHHA
ncbi:MAG: hypothetical protein NTX25_19480 [Proteobacteria bacterium]|nr:hypothetical protein [Pseudomonadota bacterium]